MNYFCNTGLNSSSKQDSNNNSIARQTSPAPAPAAGANLYLSVNASPLADFYSHIYGANHGLATLAPYPTLGHLNGAQRFPHGDAGSPPPAPATSIAAAPTVTSNSSNRSTVWRPY